MAEPVLTSPAPRRRWPLWLGIGLLLLVVAGIAGQQVVAKRLQKEIEAALGPNSEVASIETGLSSIAINGIRIRAGKDWPTEDELRAKRVVIYPDWNALLSRTIRIASIEIEDGYLSLLRRRDGKLLLLPSLLAQKDDAQNTARSGAPAKSGKGKDMAGESSATTEVSIGGIVLTGAALDFFDASVRQPAHRLRLEQTTVRLGQLRIPSLAGRTPIRLNGVVKGVQQDGKVSLDGWAELASKDSEMRTRLAAVDLVAFQPYLIKAAETGVKKGSLDLDLKSTVRKNRLHAPGKVVLSDLELSTGRTFMGMPRESVVRMLKDKDGRITADFVLEGDIGDPKFSLNEKFLAQVGAATAGVLGISLGGLAEGIGGAGAGAAEGIGSAIGKIFGSKK